MVPNRQIAIQIAFRRKHGATGLFGGWDGIISGRRDQIFDSCRGLVWSSSIPGTDHRAWFQLPRDGVLQDFNFARKVQRHFAAHPRHQAMFASFLGQGALRVSRPTKNTGTLWLRRKGKYGNLGKIPTEKTLQFQFFDNRVHPNPPINHLHFLQ